MRNGIPTHGAFCLCDGCEAEVVRFAEEQWRNHQTMCKINDPQRKLVKYFTTPERKAKHPDNPDQWYCSACNLVMAMR